jgi:hypothetical protein
MVIGSTYPDAKIVDARGANDGSPGFTYAHNPGDVDEWQFGDNQLTQLICIENFLHSRHIWFACLRAAIWWGRPTPSHISLL